MIFTEDIGYCMAHHLPRFPLGHKCRSIHGHTNTLRVTVDIPDDPMWVLDHADLRASLWEVVRLLDHAGVINDLDHELADGTAEAQLRWFWPQLAQVAATFGGTLERLDLDEDSAPGGVRLTHRKTLIREHRS
jgi:6-pyruvoyltetrahydropterin/6-carboxytetrahydropterin synthase